MLNKVQKGDDGRWYRGGLLHRENGPAVEEANGLKEWYQNNKLHRVGGPARERGSSGSNLFSMGSAFSFDLSNNRIRITFFGEEEWWVNGELHREDGPAVTRKDGSAFWYLNGFLHRTGGPAVEQSDGMMAWYFRGRRHREDGPALVGPNSLEAWYQHDLLHREDGPAFRYGKIEEWHLRGVRVTEEIVMNPEKISLAQIQKSRNTEFRTVAIEQYGWHRYLADTKAKMLDSRHNEIENTKEALFFTKSFGNRLVVTCPTGRVFTLGVPSDVTTCDQAQKWLGNDSENKFSIIGRT